PARSGSRARPGRTRRTVDGHVRRLSGGHRGGRDRRARRPGHLRRPPHPGFRVLAGLREVSATSPKGWAEGRERWELDRRPAEVLLIGSQVSFGSVGMNGVLPMLPDTRVVPLPTIVLSNLPHYPSVHANPLPAEWLAG